jgi:alkylated DNA nucleotide flippase Atl1
VSYGDVAALVGTGPRIVGQVMARYGSEVCWWRVTNAAGKLPAHLIPDAAIHWYAEGIGVSSSGSGCKIDSFRADLSTLARAFERRLARVSRQPSDV